MHIGMVCPYSLAVPGGVQAHVLDLARALRDLGHRVDVLAPAGEQAPAKDAVTSTGRTVAVRYNGSVARLAFGPLAYTRTRRWLRDHSFDVLHLHEPAAPSLSLLALSLAECPVVATFHAATNGSRALSAMRGVLQPQLEKVTARIAVSPQARCVQMKHLGGDAVEIPNGVDVARFRTAVSLPGYPRQGATVGFVGRFDEPRKGMRVLTEAVQSLAAQRPDLQLLVVGRGDEAALRRALGSRVQLLGVVDEATKAQALRSIDVLCVPGTSGESFGMVLTEAMAAGTPVVASDLPAFRWVLNEGAAGVLVPVGDSAALATALGELVDDPARQATLSAAGCARVASMDWPVVAARVLRVYETALAAVPS
ncbi:MAG: glycosyltransferase family 4 protein [Actinomycetota bacterium]|nr:glycosyltransferase family 4 protein [Actinomycetota bacterium]